MFFNIFYIKKPWKPPYTMWSAILLLLMLINLSTAQTLKPDSKEDGDDTIEINVVATPHSIQFFIKDTESYELQSVTCKIIKTGKQVDALEQVCENLDPCSSYLSALSIKNLKDENQAIIEKTIEATTEYIAPTVQTLEIKTFVDEMYLAWNASDISCISNFLIEVKSVDKEFKWTFANDKTELIIEGLNPCQEHFIQLKTYDVNETLISNLTATETTEYAEPGNVSITFEDNEGGQIRVLWESPQYKTCIRYYYLNWYVVDCIYDSCDWSANLTDSNAKEHLITQLYGCESYGVRMYINSRTNEKSDLQIFNSSEQVPDRARIEAPDINSTSTTLHWNPPAMHSRCVSYYQVNITGPLQRDDELQKNLDTVTEDTDVLFEGLDPCGQYNYTITAISLNGTGISINSSFVTIEAKPSPVRNFVVSPEPHALNITWEPPEFADLCLNGYRFSGWKDENTLDPAFDKTTNETSVQFQGLYSCQSYTIQIIPTTKTMDGELIHIDTETAANISQAPTNFQAIGLHPNSLELSAQDSDLNNKCETIFARFVCELTKNVDVPYKTAEQFVEGQVGGISFRSFLSPLSPYTEYKCNVALYNVAGWSPNRTIIKRTEAYFPDAPEEVGLKATTSTSVNYSWRTPKYENGNIKLYISHFQRVQSAYYIPPHCTPIKTEPITRETSSLEQSFTDLQPYTEYSIQVAAQNEYGIGEYTRPFMTKTSPWVSDPVLNLKVRAEGPYDSDSEYQAYVLVSWTAPCKSNGEIESFELEFTGERLDHDRQQFQRSVLPHFNALGGIMYNETNLKPEFNYTVVVIVRTKNVSTSSAVVIGEFEAPAGIPRRLNEVALGQARVNAYEANNPTSSAVVHFPASILASDSGSIMYVALLLSEKGCGPDPQLRYGVLNSNLDWPDSLSWIEVNDEGSTSCIHQYQTTPLRWKPTTVSGAYNGGQKANDEINTDVVEYIVGIEKCQDTTKRYCNGPLKADTEYNLVIRLFTKSGYNDGAILTFKTDSLIQVTLILVSVTSCLLLALIAGFVYLWVTKRILWHSEAYHGIEDSFGDVIAKNFAIFYGEVSKPDKIAREFKELTQVAMDLSYSASELGCNKNRYADIYPYDKNRVILDIDADGSDYINASFIDGYRRKKEYIATQGPKPESIMDFWRMILQHNVRVIVMVTQFREGDVVKCHEYFPFKSSGINVTVKKKDVLEIYDRTEMTVVHDNYGLKQKVVHFYFKKWPDHGCPTDPMNLITFVRKVKAEKIPSYSPIVVHCSAGVGRTGTFVGVDIIMQRLKNESKINIYETVKKLRFQRMKMVQTLMQYTFLYTCAYELVKHKNTRTAVQMLQNKSNKKVSFQDDPEFSIGDTSPVKLYPGRTGADLRSIDENEYVDRTSTVTKQMDTIGNDTLSIRFNGGVAARKSNDVQSLEELDNYMENSNESVM